MQIKDNISNLLLLINELDDLYQKSFVFRGQPDRRFFLVPNSFRLNMIREMSQAYPSTIMYNKWQCSQEVEKIVYLYLNSDKSNPQTLMHTARLHGLTLYLLQYNYHISKYIEKYPDKFDSSSLNMKDIHPPEFWCNEKSFMHFFGYSLNLSTGIIGEDGKVINYSKINEILSGYDETLPQHYGVPTAALDWTRNPYIAIFFAMRNVPKDGTQIAIYAYKEISNSPQNPIAIVSGNPNCKNERIINQEGLFTTMRYACLYYFMNGGNWPRIESFIPEEKGNFEIIKYVIDSKHISSLKSMLKTYKKGLITENFLFPNKELEYNF